MIIEGYVMRFYVLTLLILVNYSSFSQFTTKYRLAAGLFTTQIIGNNPAKLPMIATSDTDEAVTGGSFPDAQPGIELRLTFPIDDKDNLRIPFNIDYSFFRGKERINYNRNIIDYFSHTLNVLGINTGLHYVFLYVPFARAKVYTGLEVRMSFVHNIDVEWFRDYVNNDVFKDELYKIPPKENAFRLGGTFKLGVDGRLKDNLFINTGFGIGITNLIGKNDTRGELFTPITLQETGESNVINFHVFILIQYNL